MREASFAGLGANVERLWLRRPRPHLVARMLENGRLLGLMIDTHLRFFLAKRFAVRKIAD